MKEPQPEKILSDTERCWRDIETVGPMKPVGYLPIETIEDYIGKNLEAVIRHMKRKGLEVKIFTGKGWPGFRGSLYVYDKVTLQKLLDDNKQVLVDANWPTTADDFVANLKKMEHAGTPIYKLIAKTFADKFAENQEPES